MSIISLTLPAPHGTGQNINTSLFPPLLCTASKVLARGVDITHSAEVPANFRTNVTKLILLILINCSTIILRITSNICFSPSISLDQLNIR